MYIIVHYIVLGYYNSICFIGAGERCTYDMWMTFVINVWKSHHLFVSFNTTISMNNLVYEECKD